MNQINRILSRLGKALRSERGAVAVHIGVIAIALVGFSALGIEVGYLLLKHRQMQSAADGAAMSAATALGYGYPTDFRMEGKAVAGASGFTDGVDGTTVTVNSPPASGPYAGNAEAVEVLISQPQTLNLIQVYRAGLFDVGARAVALAQPGFRYCILALDPSASAAVYVQNNAVVTNPDCGVAVDSASSSALSLRNNAAINGPVHVHGDWALSNNAHLNGTPNLNNAPVLGDPYADVTLEPLPACTGQSGTVVNNVTVTLNPGKFCSGFDFSNNVTVNLQPGTYYIDSKFEMTNNVTLNGTGGVTLVITGDYALDWGNNLHVNLVAPTSGNYAGIALFGNRDAPSSIEHVFNNNSYLDVQGVIYFPNQILRFLNNGITGTSQCTQIIARIIRIYNNANLDNNCAGTGVRPIGSGLSELVE